MDVDAFRAVHEHEWARLRSLVARRNLTGAEADELVVNFDAIEVLFSDKRPFFAENQALFDVRLAGNDRLIYTRRVGGPRDDDPARAAEIDGAVKLNGTGCALWMESFPNLAQERS